MSDVRCIRGCKTNGGSVPPSRCPRCRKPQPESVQNYIAALMRAERSAGRGR